MRRALPFIKYGFVALLVGTATFLLPMHSSCGCLTNRFILTVAFFHEEDTTDAQLAQAIRTQMEGVNIKNAKPKWEGITKTNDFDFCSPSYPWNNGQAVSCEYYDKEGLFRKIGWQIDFRITPEGIIRDVKFSSMSSWLGMKTLKAIQ